jgi:hypothetical protein
MFVPLQPSGLPQDLMFVTIERFGFTCTGVCPM